jgi:hypothetical protein
MSNDDLWGTWCHGDDNTPAGWCGHVPECLGTRAEHEAAFGGLRELHPELTYSIRRYPTTADGHDATEYACPVCRRLHACHYGTATQAPSEEAP